MDAEAIKALQAPLKARYRETPEAAVITLHSEGDVEAGGVACKVDTGRALVVAGLHPASGGDGTLACSGDMLLDALVACAGVTLKAVSTSLGITLKHAVVRAEGDLDFRGTLGVSKDAPVGFRDIRLKFDLETDEPADRIETLIRLTERYCVIYQTLKAPPPLSTTLGA
jgi:uncharacterized OsmC-like protein